MREPHDPATRALNRLGAPWSPDFDAYARGEIDASQARNAPCPYCESTETHSMFDCAPKK